MKVFIIGSNGRCQYAQMYEEAGFEVVDNQANADIVQFTGGSDVSPSLYGEEAHPATFSSAERDEEESYIYDLAILAGQPMVGICRGGQFLNVMNGGKMWQDVNNHGIYGTHGARDLETGRVVQVTSTHHQMMRPAENAIMICNTNLSTSKENIGEDGIINCVMGGGLDNDTEAVYYPETYCLCFQPHPEFNKVASGDTREYFFELLERYILKED